MSALPSSIRLSGLCLGAGLTIALSGIAHAQTVSGWKGTTSNDFQTSTNWDNGFGSSFNLFVGAAWADPVKGNRLGNTTLNNAANYTGYRINFESITSPVTFTLQGSNLNLFNFSGNEPQINNASSVNQQINNNVVFKSSTGTATINPSAGNITFGATAGATTGKLFLNDASGVYQMNLAGATGKTILFNAAVNNKDGTNALRVAVTGNEDVVFAGGLIGTGDFLKQGTGTATFSTNASTFGGGTNNIFMDQGTVAVGTSGSLGTTNGTTTGLVNMGSSNNGSLNTTVNIINSAVTVANPFNIRFLQTGGKAIGGTFTSSSGTYSGPVALADHLSLNQATGGTLVFNGVVSQAAGTLSATPGAGKINNSVPQTGNSFNTDGTKGPGILVNSTGTAGTVEFDAVNTYTGDTVIETGTLQFNASGNGGSTIRLGNSSGSAAATVNIADAHSVSPTINVRPGSSAVKTISATNATATTATYSGHVALDDNATFLSTNAGAILSFTQAHGVDSTTGFDIKSKIATFSGAGDFNVSGEVYESVAGGSIVQNGSGTLFLPFTASTYTGGTTISNGILKVNTTGGLGATGSNVTINGGTLEIAQSGITTSNKNYFVGNSGGTIQTDSGVNLTLANAVANVAAQSGNLTKTGIGTLILGNTNAYAGLTNVNAGTLALGAAGSINSSTSLNLAAGATFDVSAITNFSLGASTTLSAQGTGTVAGSNAAIMNGATSVSLASQPVSLTFTPSSSTGDTTHPALVISQGTLVLSNNFIAVNNAGGAPLGPGTYRLIQVNSGVISGAPNAAANVTGSGVAAGDTATISVSGGNVNLEVRATPAFSNLASDQSISFGSSMVTFSGQISAPGPIYPAAGETVAVTVNGNTQTTMVNDATGDFSIAYDPSSIPASITPYVVAYAYAGNGQLNGASDNTRSLTVNKASQTIAFGALSAKTYGDAGFDPGATASSGLSVSYSSSNTNVATVAGHTITIVGAGMSTITASQPGDSNHNAAPSEQQTLTVNQKELTITGLTGDNKVYNGNADATFTGTPSLNGVINSDDVTLSGTATATFADKNIGNGKAISVTGYTLSGAAMSKYTLTQPSLTGNITAKELTVAGLTGANKEYDGNATAGFTGTPQLTGVVSGEENDVTLGGSPSASFPDKNVGTGKTITVSGFTITGGAIGNYTLTQPALSGNITTKTLSITADNKVKAKGGSDPSLTYASDGLVSGDSISGSLARDAGESPGSYAITQGTLDAGTNYAIDFTAGTLVITGPIATADNASRLTNSTSLTIPLATLLANDSRIAANGSTATDNLSITAVTDGVGNHVQLSGGSVVYQPTDPSASDPTTFTYTLSDGTSTDTGTVAVNTSGSPKPYLAIISRSGPVYDSGTDTTTLTVNLVGVPNQSYAIEYKSNLAQDWSAYANNPVDTGSTGAFSVTLTASGDKTLEWRRMFLHATE